MSAAPTGRSQKTLGAALKSGTGNEVAGPWEIAKPGPQGTGSEARVIQSFNMGWVEASVAPSTAMQ